MKSKVLNRSMFSQGMSPDTDNVGIMSGFMDMMDEGAESQEQLDEMEYSTSPAERRPDDLEVLMNNLRGDMRSVDARVEELAEMVGIDAAMSTPPEVLALLQPMIGQQVTQGLGALPPGMEMMAGPQPPMAPPAGGLPMGAPPPGMMPQGGGIAALPEAQGAMPPPIQMAKGGYVQRFRDGSDEEGVTPARDEGLPYPVPKEMQLEGVRRLLEIARREPSAVSTLEEETERVMPFIREQLAPNREMAQAQMLADLAGAAFAYAGNVGPDGRPLRGSGAARFAQAFRQVPGMMSERAAEISKGERGVRETALRLAGSNIEAQRGMATKTLEEGRKAAEKLATAGVLRPGMLTGDKALEFMSNYAPLYQSGTGTPDQDRLFLAVTTDYRQPTMVPMTDPVTGNVTFVERRKELPTFALEALRSRGSGVPAPSAGMPSPAAGAPAAAPAAGQPDAPTTDQGPRPTGQEPTPDGKTIWGLSSVFTGPPAAVMGAVTRIPGLGGLAPEMTQARSFVDNATRELVRVLQNSPRYAEGERQSIEQEMAIIPGFFNDPAKLRQRLIGLDDFLSVRQEVAAKNSFDYNLPSETRQQARNIENAVREFRKTLGIPVKVYSREEVKALPVGTEFLWNGKEIRERTPD